MMNPDELLRYIKELGRDYEGIRKIYISFDNSLSSSEVLIFTDGKEDRVGISKTCYQDINIRTDINIRFNLAVGHRAETAKLLMLLENYIEIFMKNI